MAEPSIFQTVANIQAQLLAMFLESYLDKLGLLACWHGEGWVFCLSSKDVKLLAELAEQPVGLRGVACSQPRPCSLQARREQFPEACLQHNRAMLCMVRLLNLNLPGWVC